MMCLRYLYCVFLVIKYSYKEIIQNKSTAFITKRRKAKCLKLERLFIETK